MKSSDAKSAVSPHGGGLRGADLCHRSEDGRGRFGRLFRTLEPAVHSRAALMALGLAMTAPADGSADTPPRPKAAPETDAHLQDDEENAGMDAGYTYLGQFIDHDITFDPASLLMQRNDPDSVINFRTPRLDLDSLYGGGPADQPYMYIGDKFRLGKKLFALRTPTAARDLPRYRDPEAPASAARALIGDKRNDENVIVSQLHGVFLQLHNRFVDALGPGARFEQARRLTCWHYQFVVLNDFLVRVCGAPMVDAILPNRRVPAPAWHKRPHLHFFHWRAQPRMPIEFSVAAYRFGHSTVRPIYRLNQELKGGDDPEQASDDERARGLEGRFFIFAGVERRALNGFGEFSDQWAIDWSLFFDIDGSGQMGGKARAQPSYKIDTSLVNPLGFLPEFSVVVPFVPPLTIEQLQPKPKEPRNDPATLAARNLLRGLAMELPSGQAVARAMGLDVIADAHLRVGMATLEGWDEATPLTAIDPAFADNAPLWYYVLAEAQYEWYRRASGPEGQGDAEPVTLGPVGGRIVAETLIGLLYSDPHSFLVQEPNWIPTVGGMGLTMGQLIEYALGADSCQTG
jgi:hypothetical protein